MPHEAWSAALSQAFDDILHDANGKLLPLAPDVDLSDTFTMKLERWAEGSFICPNCRNRWSSHKVPIVFEYGYNKKVEDFEISIKEGRQSCRKCNQGKAVEQVFAEPDLFPDSLNRPATLLVKKIGIKFYGLPNDGSGNKEAV